jgi:hypothetical protein
MGDIADDMTNGACCALCGVYFKEEHRFPVACPSCYEKDCGYELAIIDEI